MARSAVARSRTSSGRPGRLASRPVGAVRWRDSRRDRQLRSPSMRGWPARVDFGSGRSRAAQRRSSPDACHGAHALTSIEGYGGSAAVGAPRNPRRLAKAARRSSGRRDGCGGCVRPARSSPGDVGWDWRRGARPAGDRHDALGRRGGVGCGKVASSPRCRPSRRWPRSIARGCTGAWDLLDNAVKYTRRGVGDGKRGAIRHRVDARRARHRRRQFDPRTCRHIFDRLYGGRGAVGGRERPRAAIAKSSCAAGGEIGSAASQAKVRHSGPLRCGQIRPRA